MNFEKMNKLAGQQRYVVQGNQVQLGLMSEIGLQTFYYYSEFLGSNLIEFSATSRSLLAKDGLQVYRYTSNTFV